MDPKKVTVIINWESPINIQDIQGFLGFANFYYWFINYFLEIIQPLTNLIKKNIKFK